MKEGRIRRNRWSIFLGLVVLIMCLIFKITPSKINNYTDIISAILSLSSMATSFLFASFALIPALPDSKLLKGLKELGTDKKLLDRLLITIIGFVLCSIFSLIALAISSRSNSLFANIILSVMSGLLAFSLLDLLKVLRILLVGIEHI